MVTAVEHPAPRFRAGTVECELAAVEGSLRAHRRRVSDEDVALVERAGRLADEVHRGQFRRSGEAYISHPLAVAAIVAGLGLDALAVAAALLHDAVEDTGLSLDELREDFGDEVAAIVDGVTKLDRLEFDSKEAQQAATVRKMIVAMANDWRVLVIKLADRLHNMRTLAVMPEWKQRRTAQETLDIYAPLAHRLGIQELKWQLEDLAFATLHPKRYAEIEQMVATRDPQREELLERVLAAVRDRLAVSGVAAEVTGRPKHLWSIYEKMVVRGKEFAEIYDLLGIRVIVESEKDCWAALGSIHAIWSPLHGRFKDYINNPKFNLYQSLHTTVVGLDGRPIEVQIRTEEMHRRAEFGIAAHWGYKEGTKDVAGGGEMAWIQRIVDWQQDTLDPLEFLETLKVDLEQDEVYVFTPKGKVIALPARSTPVDFAYTIHTEVGHHCIGAKVNGRLVPLDTRLRSADIVEIITSKVPSARPSRDWLKIVASPRARNKIRQWFSRERREDAIEAGREELTKALRREGLPTQKAATSRSLEGLAAQMSYTDLDSLYAAIGEGHLSGRSIAQRLARELHGGNEEQLPTTVSPGAGRSRIRRSSPVGVFVEGLDDVMVRLSRCCTPVPGDDIVGFVTRGRGVSVHRADCSNASSLFAEEGGRLIEVEWDREGAPPVVATIEVLAFDRSALLSDVTRVVAEHRLNIVASASQTTPDRVSRMRFDVELADPAHLESLLSSLKHLDCVFDAYRVLPGRKA